MTGGSKNSGRKAAQTTSNHSSSQDGLLGAHLAFNDLCNSIGELCTNDNDTNIIEQLQGLLKDKQNQPGLSDNIVTAVSVTQLLLPVLGFTNHSVDKRLSEQSTAINRMKAAMRSNVYETDRLAQYTRRENVRIAGIPETEGENVKQKIIDLAQVMGVNIAQNDINACHRLSTRHQTRARAIIVRFFARDKRNQMLINKNKLKDNVDYKNVFIAEDLTQLRAKLLHYVKREERVASAYTRDGKIICQLRDNSRIVLESPDDLFKIGLTDVDFHTLGLSNLV